MSQDFLEASLSEDRQKTEAIINLKVSDDWFAEKDIISIRLNDYRTDTEYFPWGLRAIGLRESREMVGFIGFHSRPDSSYLRSFAPNAIEFGYTIFFAYRRRGFALEAITSLMKWAVKRQPIDNFIASVSPANIASTSLIKKLGFDKIAEQTDEIDGLEFVYRLPAAKLKLMDDQLLWL